MLRVVEMALKEVLLIEPDVHEDTRGFFYELYHRDKYRKAGIGESFVQDNLARSREGVLRGLHYQLRSPQGKLVMAVEGKIYDVAVDIRQGSPSFGKWCGIELSADNKSQLYVPPGFAHGYYVLTEYATVFYKCTAFYVPEDACGIIWNDPMLAIAWPVANPLLSSTDRSYQTLEESRTRLPHYHG